MNEKGLEVSSVKITKITPLLYDKFYLSLRLCKRKCSIIFSWLMKKNEQIKVCRVSVPEAARNCLSYWHRESPKPLHFIEWDNVWYIFYKAISQLRLKRLIVFVCQRVMIFWTSTLLFCYYLFSILSVL